MTWKRALEKAINKWETIAFDNPAHLEECALCKKNGGYAYCYGCPVHDVTGRDGCDGSPFRVWVDRKDNFGHDHHYIIDAAIHELMFLYLLYHEFYSD